MADRSSLYQSLCTFDVLSVFVLSLLLIVIATVFAPFPVLYRLFSWVTPVPPGFPFGSFRIPFVWPSGYSPALSRVFPASGTCGPHRPSLSPTGPPSTLILTNPFRVGGLRAVFFGRRLPVRSSSGRLLRTASVPGAVGLLPVVPGPAS